MAVNRNQKFEMRNKKLLETEFAGIKLRNPVLIASGIVGFGEEYSGIIDFSQVGGLITKTITLEPRTGNLPPRVCEVSSGMLNSIGLENPGIDTFIKDKLPFLRKLDTKIIVSIAGKTIQDYVSLVKTLDKIKGIDGIELNLSCPNVKHSLHNQNCLISQNADSTEELVVATRKYTKLPLLSKLSPNVTDITAIAQSAESAGADGIVIANTFYGMAIDTKSRKPKLGNIIGGLSGPAIKPIILRMVYETFKKIKIPIMGVGGINSADDTIEFIVGGAKTIAVGSALFSDPDIINNILKGLTKYLIEHKIMLSKLYGSLLL